MVWHARPQLWDAGEAHGTAASRELTMELIFAYIDPGSGSLIVQALIAGLVAVPIFFRRQISRFLGTLRRRDETVEAAATQDDPPKGA